MKTQSKTYLFQLDLVCSKTIFKAHAQTAGSVGSLVGYFVMGPVSDR